MSVIQVRPGEAFSDRSGLSNMICSVPPITPLASIIQNRISEPINGVTIMGSSEKKIVGPLNRPGSLFTDSAITKPRMITSGVTTKV